MHICRKHIVIMQVQRKYSSAPKKSKSVNRQPAALKLHSRSLNQVSSLNVPVDIHTAMYDHIVFPHIPIKLQVPGRESMRVHGIAWSPLAARAVSAELLCCSKRFSVTC